MFISAIIGCVRNELSRSLPAVNTVVYRLSTRKMFKIVAFGNVLLDTTVKLQNETLLLKHNLKKDDQKEVPDEAMERILEDIQGYEKFYSAGGCAQNTLRVVQWLSGKQFSTLIFGTVGSDERAGRLEKILANDGVQTKYVEHTNLPTGLAIALINGQDRSLVANLGASEVLNVNHVIKSNILAETEDADIVYFEGFFLTKRAAPAQHILSHCQNYQRLVVFNISGQYVCKEYPDIARFFSENCDIIMGNRREFEALGATSGLNSVELLMEKLKGKIIVVTDGPGPVVCADCSGSIVVVEVPVIKDEDMVDTVGAGDAFAAGFLFGYLRKKSLKACVEIGCYAASEIIRNTGCTLPKHPPQENRLE